jgi:hypothetical protein
LRMNRVGTIFWPDRRVTGTGDGAVLPRLGAGVAVRVIPEVAQLPAPGIWPTQGPCRALR